MHIGAREIYDQLVGMREDVRSLVQDREDTDRALADHEERLRKVEKLQYAAPVGAITGLLGGLAAVAKAAGII
ncbi:hypothetical protein PBI_NESBITT_22 [Streptomyces phage Nesbitt]|uniref:Uncharacterized protein n=2 Tax=Abbeymikolonvirus abbeymikolon TaxID=2734213 RepID=A0A2P1JT06_9CAUD|nr:hypothetical protein HOS57_gp22 [Streptomyces phage AbbeyMikolon]AUG87094.1 hypothetical protein SEA_ABBEYMIKOLON_22 [Streptomyces phage AbbeyMikolon]AVO22279.1 hypothetical protein PBI_NESBITT_22 [Streptomyces phage Nesbitt]